MTLTSEAVTSKGGSPKSTALRATKKPSLKRRSPEEKLEIVQRALNKDKTGETIANIAKDFQTSESIVYLLLKRHRERAPLDQKGGRRSSVVIASPPRDKAEEEAAHYAALFDRSNTSFSAEAPEVGDTSLELEVVYLRKRVKQLLQVVRMLLDD
jgi:transposase-like protein